MTSFLVIFGSIFVFILILGLYFGLSEERRKILAKFTVFFSSRILLISILAFTVWMIFLSLSAIHFGDAVSAIKKAAPSNVSLGEIVSDANQFSANIDVIETLKEINSDLRNSRYDIDSKLHDHKSAVSQHKIEILKSITEIYRMFVSSGFDPLPSQYLVDLTNNVENPMTQFKPVFDKIFDELINRKKTLCDNNSDKAVCLEKSVEFEKMIKAIIAAEKKYFEHYDEETILNQRRGDFKAREAAINNEIKTLNDANVVFLNKYSSQSNNGNASVSGDSSTRSFDVMYDIAHYRTFVVGPGFDMIGWPRIVTILILTVSMGVLGGLLGIFKEIMFNGYEPGETITYVDSDKKPMILSGDIVIHLCQSAVVSLAVYFAATAGVLAFGQGATVGANAKPVELNHFLVSFLGVLSGFSARAVTEWFFKQGYSLFGRPSNLETIPQDHVAEKKKPEIPQGGKGSQPPAAEPNGPAGAPSKGAGSASKPDTQAGGASDPAP